MLGLGLGRCITARSNSKYSELEVSSSVRRHSYGHIKLNQAGVDRDVYRSEHAFSVLIPDLFGGFTYTTHNSKQRFLDESLEIHAIGVCHLILPGYKAFHLILLVFLIIHSKRLIFGNTLAMRCV